jgi:hypothetical protein
MEYKCQKSELVRTTSCKLAGTWQHPGEDLGTLDCTETTHVQSTPYLNNIHILLCTIKLYILQGYVLTR